METMRNKQDYATVISDIADDFLGYVGMECPEVSPVCVERVEETVKGLLDFEKPRVMVYGVYNSGKSTLINALMKEEVAEMADRPMTDQISLFDHGDYLLVDSPGIDAPIAHEKITDEFLNKCHIILFVISSKGGFEGKYNYEKMADLINRDIPFIIVLNERGCLIKQEWSAEEKALKKAEYGQELRSIQYKIIENLRKVTGDKNITDKYESYVLNARKALLGIQKNNEKLYDSSNIKTLDKRIIQLIQSGSAAKVMKQPISNLKECFDYIEQYIAQEMQAGSSENFADKVEILRKKGENLKDEMRILIQQTTQGHADELAQLYAAGNAEMAEGIEYTILQEVEDKYGYKLADVLTYIRKSFQEIEGVMGVVNLENEIFYTPRAKNYSARNIERKEALYEDEAPVQEERKKEFFLFEMFKSNKKREREKLERLEREAALINMRNQNRLNEELRIRQEARQAAVSDMIELQNALIVSVNTSIDEKFGEIMSYIQEIDCQNQELLQEGKRKLQELTEIRRRLAAVENDLV